NPMSHLHHSIQHRTPYACRINPTDVVHLVDHDKLQLIFHSLLQWHLDYFEDTPFDQPYLPAYMLHYLMMIQVVLQEYEFFVAMNINLYTDYHFQLDRKSTRLNSSHVSIS